MNRIMVARELLAAAKDIQAATEYQEFFQKKLKEHGVGSPAELSDAEKKKFFDEIEKEWKGEKD